MADPDTVEDINQSRLSDRVLYALEGALEQEDLLIAEKLVQALDLSMTRGSGGNDFVERRGYPERIENALARFETLRGKNTP